MSNDRQKQIKAIEMSFNFLTNTSQNLISKHEKDKVKNAELSNWKAYIEELRQEFNKVKETLDDSELNDVYSILRVTTSFVLTFIDQGISVKASINTIINELKIDYSSKLEEKYLQQCVEQRKGYGTKKLIGGTAFCAGIALYAMGVVAAVTGIGLIPALVIGGLGFLVSAAGGLGFGKSFIDHHSLKKEHKNEKSNSVYQHKLRFFDRLTTKQTDLIKSSFTNLDNANKAAQRNVKTLDELGQKTEEDIIHEDHLPHI